MRVLSENDQIQHFMSVSHSEIEFCGVQKQKGKLVFSKSGVFHLWHIVSSVAQGQFCSRSRYKIHVIKNSGSPEKEILDFFQTFPKS